MPGGGVATFIFPLLGDRTFKHKYQYFHIDQWNSRNIFCQGPTRSEFFFSLFTFTYKYKYFHINRRYINPIYLYTSIHRDKQLFKLVKILVKMVIRLSSNSCWYSTIVDTYNNNNNNNTRKGIWTHYLIIRKMKN